MRCRKTNRHRALKMRVQASALPYLLLSASLLASCAVASPAIDQVLDSSTVMLFDFENSPEVPDEVTTSNSSVYVAPSDDGRGLRASLASKENYFTAVTFEADDSWDLSAENAVLAFDISNPGDYSVQITLDIQDTSGATHTRSAVVPVGRAQTYFVELTGPNVEFDTGLRNPPPAVEFDGHQFVWMWGVKAIDASAIKSLSFTTIGLNHDREFVIDNIRLEKDLAPRDTYVTAVLDKYGQSAKETFPIKVESDEMLAALTAKEAEALTEGAPADRSKYGGWSNGFKFDATGYFRTEKIGDRWSLIDPDGYMFFSTGLANVRMSNTSTMTGFDFDAELLKARSSDDLTPEDSVGLNRAPKRAWSSRHSTSELRSNMFEWLPEYDDPLGDHFGYRRSAHQGPVQQGETFSFYRANLERKYGETSPESYMQDWEDNTIDRMLNWGFTSFGNWVDPSFYDNNRFPYFANGWIIGDFKTVSSGDDYWAPLPDPFDPVFRERTKVTVAQIAEEVQNNPWCIGVFIDNEKSWGRTGTPEGQYGIVINTLSRNGAESPTKREFTRLLQGKYESIEALNAAWSTEIESWKALDRGVELTDHSAAKQADYAILLEAYASEYFRIVHDELEAVMPNHMYMGARFATWGRTPEVVRAAAKYADVMSYNEYREVLHDETWGFLDEIDKPALIGEFHIGTTNDTGFYHPGLVIAADQNDRARMFKEYMHTVIDNPNFVGVHWFQYIDSPITGRAFDGENYNVGFVSVADVPYPEMVKAAQEIGDELYERRFGDLTE